MNNILIKLLILSYAAQGVFSLIAFWPTMKDLLAGRKSANVNSYLIWTICYGIALLYGLFILEDLLFRIVSAITFGACAIILILAVRLKNKKTPARESLGQLE